MPKPSQRRGGKKDYDDDGAGTTERAVRFGCGALIGGALFLGYGLTEAHSMGGWLGGIVATALICGFLAMLWGDVFWEKIGELFRWR